MVTVGLAVALAVVGVILAWPVEPAVALLAPIGDITQSFGLAPDSQTGYLCLFASSALLVARSLLPGIRGSHAQPHQLRPHGPDHHRRPRPDGRRPLGTYG